MKREHPPITNRRLRELYDAAVSGPDGVSGDIVLGNGDACTVATADEMREALRMAKEYGEEWPDRE